LTFFLLLWLLISVISHFYLYYTKNSGVLELGFLKIHKNTIRKFGKQARQLSKHKMDTDIPYFTKGNEPHSRFHHQLINEIRTFTLMEIDTLLSVIKHLHIPSGLHFKGSWKNNSRFLGKRLPDPADVVTTVLRPAEDLRQT
jgi:hypothetical protein